MPKNSPKPFSLFLASILLLGSMGAAHAQDTPSRTGGSDDSSDQVEESEEAYRRRMELEGARQQETFSNTSYSSQASQQKIDKLPEESQQNIRAQITDIIIESDEWEPSDVLEEYPYQPTAAAEEDSELRDQELEAWAEQVDKYHEREAAAFGATRPPMPGAGQQQAGTGDSGEGQQQGEQGQGKEGAGQGGSQSEKDAVCLKARWIFCAESRAGFRIPAAAEGGNRLKYKIPVPAEMTLGARQKNSQTALKNNRDNRINRRILRMPERNNRMKPNNNNPMPQTSRNRLRTAACRLNNWSSYREWLPSKRLASRLLPRHRQEKAHLLRQQLQSQKLTQQHKSNSHSKTSKPSRKASPRNSKPPRNWISAHPASSPSGIWKSWKAWSNHQRQINPNHLAGKARLVSENQREIRYPAFPGEVGYLFPGQSGCREQPISAQGRLERVLETGTRPLPPARPISHPKVLNEFGGLCLNGPGFPSKSASSEVHWCAWQPAHQTACRFANSSFQLIQSGAGSIRNRFHHRTFADRHPAGHPCR